MQLAIEILVNIHIVKRSIELIKTERSKIFEKLNKISQIKIFESHSNFFFFQTFDHFDKIKNSMNDEKILVKNFGNLGNYRGAMRITIGNTEINDKIISIFEKSQLT
jgi:histidinol-phosphate aminotransferase